MKPEDIEVLRRLKSLQNDGVLTEEEFESQKRQILNSSESAVPPGVVSESLLPDDAPFPLMGMNSESKSVAPEKEQTSDEGPSNLNRRRAILGGLLGLAVIVAIVLAVSGGGDGSQSKNPIDERMKVSVRCVVTDLEQDSILDINEVSDSQSLWTIAGQQYFYFTRYLTVTNYDDEAQQVYVEHRYVDDNGKVWGSWNFLEYVNGGETQTFEENRIVDAPSEIVLRGNSATGEMTFDCPVVRANL